MSTADGTSPAAPCAAACLPACLQAAPSRVLMEASSWCQHAPLDTVPVQGCTALGCLTSLHMAPDAGSCQEAGSHGPLAMQVNGLRQTQTRTSGACLIPEQMFTPQPPITPRPDTPGSCKTGAWLALTPIWPHNCSRTHAARAHQLALGRVGAAGRAYLPDHLGCDVLFGAGGSVGAVSTQEGRAHRGPSPVVDMQVGAVSTAARSLHSCMPGEHPAGGKASPVSAFKPGFLHPPTCHLKGQRVGPHWWLWVLLVPCGGCHQLKPMI